MNRRHCLRISPREETAGYVRVDHQTQIFACSLEGSSEEIHLLSGPTWGLTWAPDGKRLIVTTSEDKFVDKRWVPRMQTWLISADGSGKTQLPIPDTHIVLDWSGDGKFLLTSVPLRTQPPASQEDFQYAL